MFWCSTLLKLAQADTRATGEDPEGRIDGLGERKRERVEGIGFVGHVVERSPALLAVQQHADPLGAGVSQHRLLAVVPGGQLHVEPLHAPRLVVAAQPAVGAFAVDAAVGQADADEVVAAQADLPVVAPCGETLGGEDLGADGEALGAVGVAHGLVGDGRLGGVLAERDAFMGRPWIEGERSAVWRNQKNSEEGFH